MSRQQWILCPICGNKTRIMIREDTELRNFPLYCPKCKKETIGTMSRKSTTVLKEILRW